MTKQIICDIIVRLLFIAFGIILVLKSRDYGMTSRRV